MRVMITIEHFYEFENKILHIIKDKLHISNQLLNRKVDINILNKLLKQKGISDVPMHSVEDPYNNSSDDNTNRKDEHQPKGLLSRRKVDVCGSCERPVLTSEAAEEGYNNKKNDSNKNRV